MKASLYLPDSDSLLWRSEDNILFYRFLRTSNYRNGTISLIKTAVNGLINWFDAYPQFGGMNFRASTMEKYVSWLLMTRGSETKVGSYTQQQLWAIGIWIQYLSLTGRLKSTGFNPPGGVRPDSPVRVVCSEAEIHDLFMSCRTDIEFLALVLTYGCGLRRSEISSFQWKDLCTERSMLSVMYGKGGHHRLVPLPDSVCGRLSILKQKCPGGQSFVFWPHLSRSTVGKRLATTLDILCQRAGISRKITLHEMRHSLATHLADRGYDVLCIQKILGHCNPATTIRYMSRRRSIRELTFFT